MIRQTHTGALEGACEEVALDNSGFFYSGNKKHRSKVKEIYKNHTEVQNKTKIKPKISDKKIKSQIEDIAAKDNNIQKRQETGAYWYNIFNNEEWDKDLIDEFEALFKSNPIVTRQKIEAEVEKHLKIADNDIEFLLRKFSENDYLERIDAGSSVFYFAGEDLYKESSKPLTDVEQELAKESNEEAKLTRRRIENALEIDAPDKLVRVLEERGHLVQVDSDYWLPNDIHSILTYTQSIVEDKIAPTIENKFDQRDWVFDNKEFERTIRNQLQQRTGFITSLDPEAREKVLEKVQQKVIAELVGENKNELEVRKFNELVDDGNIAVEKQSDEECRYWMKKVEEKIEAEANRLNKERGDTDLRYFVNNEFEELIDINSDNKIVRQMYKDRTEEKLKEIVN
jgi:hypothetical protein